MSTRLLSAALLLTLAATAQASDDFNAQQFLEQNCTRCHDERVYTRDDRRVQSLQGLENQVRRCDSMLGTKLLEDDLHLLTDHLNQRFYHF